MFGEKSREVQAVLIEVVEKGIVLPAPVISLCFCRHWGEALRGASEARCDKVIKPETSSRTSLLMFSIKISQAQFAAGGS